MQHTDYKRNMTLAFIHIVLIEFFNSTDYQHNISLECLNRFG